MGRFGVIAWLALACSSGGTSKTPDAGMGADAMTGRDGTMAPDGMTSPDAMSGPCAQAPAQPPAALGLDSFYRKYVPAPLPIVGSERVRDAAFAVACDIVLHMLAKR